MRTAILLLLTVIFTQASCKSFNQKSNTQSDDGAGDATQMENELSTLAGTQVVFGDMTQNFGENADPSSYQEFKKIAASVKGMRFSQISLSNSASSPDLDHSAQMYKDRNLMAILRTNKGSDSMLAFLKKMNEIPPMADELSQKSGMNVYFSGNLANAEQAYNEFNKIAQEINGMNFSIIELAYQPNGINNFITTTSDNLSAAVLNAALGADSMLQFLNSKQGN